jgi:hypothetical protein
MGTTQRTIGVETRGRTDGVTVPVGYVGEKLAATLSNSGTLTTATPTNVGTISLTAGIWLVYAKGYLEVTSSTSTYTSAQVSVSTISATIDNTTRDLKNLPVNSTDLTFTPGILYVNNAAVSTVYLVASVTYTGGAIRFNGSNSEFIAVRVA